MAAGLQIFEPAYTFIDGKLDTFLNADVSNVIAQVAGPMRAALVLYVLLYGFAILRGSISEPIVDFAIRSLKLAFIFMLATTVAYSSWITTPLFQTLPNTLAQALGGNASTDPGTAFDQFFDHAAFLGEEIGATASLVNPVPLLMSGAVYVIGALVAALGFGIVIVAKVTLALLVALGPIFIACSLFDASRRFFFGWLSQAVNYLVLMALIITVFQMILSLVDDQWGQITGQPPMSGGLIFIALSILGAVFFLQTPSIAAGIAGGAGAGIADFGAGAGMAFKGVSRLDKSAAEGGRALAQRVRSRRASGAGN
jgi:type IV secretion system protein VirB6